MKQGARRQSPARRVNARRGTSAPGAYNTLHTVRPHLRTVADTYLVLRIILSILYCGHHLFAAGTGLTGGNGAPRSPGGGNKYKKSLGVVQR